MMVEENKYLLIKIDENNDEKKNHMNIIDNIFNLKYIDNFDENKGIIYYSKIFIRNNIISCLLPKHFTLNNIFNSLNIDTNIYNLYNIFDNKIINLNENNAKLPNVKEELKNAFLQNNDIKYIVYYIIFLYSNNQHYKIITYQQFLLTTYLINHSNCIYIYHLISFLKRKNDIKTMDIYINLLKKLILYDKKKIYNTDIDFIIEYSKIKNKNKFINENNINLLKKFFKSLFYIYYDKPFINDIILNLLIIYQKLNNNFKIKIFETILFSNPKNINYIIAIKYFYKINLNIHREIDYNFNLFSYCDTNINHIIKNIVLCKKNKINDYPLILDKCFDCINAAFSIEIDFDICKISHIIHLFLDEFNQTINKNVIEQFVKNIYNNIFKYYQMYMNIKDTEENKINFHSQFILKLIRAIKKNDISQLYIFNSLIQISYIFLKTYNKQKYFLNDILPFFNNYKNDKYITLNPIYHEFFYYEFNENKHISSLYKKYKYLLIHDNEFKLYVSSH